MKTKKIQKPFSVEAWKNGAKVETRDGREVRILCTDLKGNYSIVAAVTCKDGEEASMQFCADGCYYSHLTAKIDLVIVEEVEEPERWAEDKDVVGEGWTICDDDCLANITYRAGMPLNDNRNYDIFATEKQAKSALAMARISQLMAHDERYGGVVTDKEWKDAFLIKHTIDRINGAIDMGQAMTLCRFLAFHTKEQRDLFLTENEQLVKDYLMIE